MKIIIGIILILIVVLSIVNWSIQNIHVSADTDLGKHFPDKQVLSYFIELEDRTMRYVYRKGGTKNLILFIHGAPGSWKDFKKYLGDEELASQSSMVAVDRFGYGASTSREVEHDIAEQAKPLKLILDRFDFENLVLVGHSYGSPVAARVAIDLPDSMAALIMLCPVNDPHSEKPFWFNKLLNTKLVSYLLSDAVYSSVQENVHHAKALKNIEDIWPRINIPVFHLHSKDDWIAPYEENMAFSKKHIKPEFLYAIEVPGKSHFIPWNDFEDTKALILQQLN